MQKLYSKKLTQRERNERERERTEEEPNTNGSRTPPNGQKNLTEKPTEKKPLAEKKKTINICGMVGKLKSTEMVDNFMDPPPKQIKLGMVFN